MRVDAHHVTGRSRLWCGPPAPRHPGSHLASRPSPGTCRQVAKPHRRSRAKKTALLGAPLHSAIGPGNTNLRARRTCEITCSRRRTSLGRRWRIAVRRRHERRWWCRRQGSNPRPAHYKWAALPTELRRLVRKAPGPSATARCASTGDKPAEAPEAGCHIQRRRIPQQVPAARAGGASRPGSSFYHQPVRRGFSTPPVDKPVDAAIRFTFNASLRSAGAVPLRRSRADRRTR